MNLPPLAPLPRSYQSLAAYVSQLTAASWDHIFGGIVVPAAAKLGAAYAAAVAANASRLVAQQLHHARLQQQQQQQPGNQGYGQQKPMALPAVPCPGLVPVTVTPGDAAAAAGVPGAFAPATMSLIKFHSGGTNKGDRDSDSGFGGGGYSKRGGGRGGGWRGGRGGRGGKYGRSHDGYGDDDDDNADDDDDDKSGSSSNPSDFAWYLRFAPKADQFDSPASRSGSSGFTTGSGSGSHGGSGRQYGGGASSGYSSVTGTTIGTPQLPRDLGRLDLWAVSLDGSFSNPFLFVSLWHSFTPRGLLQLLPLHEPLFAPSPLVASATGAAFQSTLALHSLSSSDCGSLGVNASNPALPTVPATTLTDAVVSPAPAAASAAFSLPPSPLAIKLSARRPCFAYRVGSLSTEAPTLAALHSALGPLAAFSAANTHPAFALTPQQRQQHQFAQHPAQHGAGGAATLSSSGMAPLPLSVVAALASAPLAPMLWRPMPTTAAEQAELLTSLHTAAGWRSDGAAATSVQGHGHGHGGFRSALHTEPPSAAQLLPPLAALQRALHSQSRLDWARARVAAACDAAVARFPLNGDQFSVLQQCAAWVTDLYTATATSHADGSSTHDAFAGAHDTRTGTHGTLDGTRGATVAPLVLVHGVFGSGKSHLLACCLLMLATALAELDPECTVRILLAAHTNTAADNVLLRLRRAGCREFARVGSAMKIDKGLLAFTAHGLAAPNAAAAANSGPGSGPAGKGRKRTKAGASSSSASAAGSAVAAVTSSLRALRDRLAALGRSRTATAAAGLFTAKLVFRNGNAAAAKPSARSNHTRADVDSEDDDEEAAVRAAIADAEDELAHLRALSESGATQKQTARGGSSLFAHSSTSYSHISRDVTLETRSQRLLKARIIGTTCISSSSDALRGQRFALGFIDEASQTTEPLALLPLLRAGAEAVALVGDPLQLPPTLPALTALAGLPWAPPAYRAAARAAEAAVGTDTGEPDAGDGDPAAVVSSNGGGSLSDPGAIAGLGRSLFVRLARFAITVDDNDCSATVATNTHTDTPSDLSGAISTAVSTPRNNAAFASSRAATAGGPVCVRLVRLRMQYRVHPAIADLLSGLFYRGRLTSGVAAAARAPLLLAPAAPGPRAVSTIPALPPVVFCDVPDGREERVSAASGSLSNPAEAAAVVSTVARLLLLRVPARCVGVIVPFRAQASAIRTALETLAADRAFAAEFLPQTAAAAAAGAAANTGAAAAGRAGAHGQSGAGLYSKKAALAAVADSSFHNAGESSCINNLDGNDGSAYAPDSTVEANAEEDYTVYAPTGVLVSTVDAFQGGEREIIVMSCVKTQTQYPSQAQQGGESASFIDNANRLCVSLSRAKRHLIVFGRASLLCSSNTSATTASATGTATGTQQQQQQQPSLWSAVVKRARMTPRGYYRNSNDLLTFLGYCERLNASLLSQGADSDALLDVEE